MTVSHIALNKRAKWANCSCHSLKKSNVSDLFVIRVNRLQKQSDLLEKFIFFICYWQFFPFFMPKSESLPSLFAHLLFFKERLEQFSPIALYKRATVSDLLRSLMKKEQRDRFAKVAHDKRATGAFCSFSQANCSYSHKKQANCSKNRWANFQPCLSPLQIFHWHLSLSANI